MTPLILASQSSSRAALLQRAALSFVQRPSDIDEEVRKNDFLATHMGPLSALALFLAHEKGRDVSQKYPDDLVLAADQILVFQDRVYSKAQSITEARDILIGLRGQKHTLPTAMVLYRAGQPVWEHLAIPMLSMRSFSDDFLDAYLKNHGINVLSAVGCYQIEGAGIHLMDTVEGDSSTIQGLSLLPLLTALRALGFLAP